MADTIGELQVLIGADASNFQSGMRAVESQLGAVGKSAMAWGAQMAVIAAPIGIAFGAAAKSAIDFDSQMHNISAVTGTTGTGLDKMAAQIREIGTASRYGSQGAVSAFYDIAGGVADVSVRMDILKAAIATAQAGQADLAGTTKALISVMNSYGFSAKEASYASDVLTQTVAAGVGTMDQFAAALPMVTGLAHDLGISFGDLGAMAAYLTTKGHTASEATTELSAMMTALIKPTKQMKQALLEIGFASGEAAIKQLGLAGTYKKLADAGLDVKTLTGRIEAMRGAMRIDWI
jgi:TP901 family phage tail tape measure protein